jgi:hypothetical protein
MIRRDQYQRALRFLAANEPEQCLRVQLPFEKYEELESNADMAKKVTTEMFMVVSFSD